jgi:hypothetical protein
MEEDKTRRPIVALFPSAKAHLIINEATVTCKIPQAIRFEAGSLKIREETYENTCRNEMNGQNAPLTKSTGKPTGQVIHTIAPSAVISSNSVIVTYH